MNYKTIRLGLTAWMAVAFLAAAGCELARRPTLEETRTGRATTQAPDTSARPGEIIAEVERVDPVRQELRVRTDDGRTLVLSYDRSTRVSYQDRVYEVANLEKGDVIAFRPSSDNYVSSVRVHETVQDRLAKGDSRRPSSRLETVDGTVETIDRDRGVFDLRTRSGQLVTVALPFNASNTDVDDFRQLRRGDSVRIEGNFVNPNTFQLHAFVSGPFRARR